MVAVGWLVLIVIGATIIYAVIRAWLGVKRDL
jgi:hypothetical protein